MLNTNVTVNTKMNVPVAGTIQKSNKDSIFLTMHYRSRLAEKLFEGNPIYNEEKVAVLQVLLMHENWMLVEVVPLDKL